MRGTDPWPAEDPLTEALQFLRMSGSFYCRSELTAPWGLALPAMPGCLWFHVVTAGNCWLEVDGAEARPLQPGDVALVPHGEGHRIYSARGVATPPILELEREHVSARYEILRHGAGGEATILVCGGVTFNHPAAHNLIDLLPKIMYVQASAAPQTDRMQRTIQLIATEAEEPLAGGEIVITRLSDVLVMQVIRAWLEYAPGAQSGWLAAVSDSQIGPVFSLIHRDPARPWTVETLASELAMSRSAFSARFTQLVGEPVMRYVTRRRMQVAVDALTGNGVTVGELADRLGYQSEAAFSRAFKRNVGLWPGAVRRNGTRE